jgi:hypothetical protein
MGRCSSRYVIHLVWDYATYPIFLPPFRPFSSSYFFYLAADCVSIVGQDPSVFPIVGISAVFFTWFFSANSSLPALHTNSHSGNPIFACHCSNPRGYASHLPDQRSSPGASGELLRFLTA